MRFIKTTLPGGASWHCHPVSRMALTSYEGQVLMCLVHCVHCTCSLQRWLVGGMTGEIGDEILTVLVFRMQDEFVSPIVFKNLLCLKLWCGCTLKWVYALLCAIVTGYYVLFCPLRVDLMPTLSENEITNAWAALKKIISHFLKLTCTCTLYIKFVIGLAAWHTVVWSYYSISNF